MVNTSKTPRPRERERTRPGIKRAYKLNVLIACEESQAECLAFRDLGHRAFSCDIQPCNPKGRPDYHIMGDVLPLLQGWPTFKTQDKKRHQCKHWDLIIAHPPCTYLSKLSSVQLAKNPDYIIMFNGLEKHVNYNRYYLMKKSREFFMKCLDAKADYIAVENPIPMKLAQLPPPSAYACPSWYGVKYTKKTLYWLKGLPPLFPELENPNAKCYVSSSRGKYRSRTFPKMAQAIARQWSDYIIMQKIMTVKKNKQ